MDFSVATRINIIILRQQDPISSVLSATEQQYTWVTFQEENAQMSAEIHVKTLRIPVQFNPVVPLQCFWQGQKLLLVTDSGAFRSLCKCQNNN